MKKTVTLITLITLSIPVTATAKQFSNYGFVEDGSGSFNTLNEKIYEWDQFPKGCYCFPAAGATAINIRMGGKKVDTKSAYNYFVNKLAGYSTRTDDDGDLNNTGGQAGCATSSQDWINASNYLHIEDLNIKQKPSAGYFSDMESFWDEVKRNVDSDKPMLIPITHWSPEYSSNKKFTIASGFTRLMGHAITVVGYADFSTKYVAIRDPAIQAPVNSHKHRSVFDYLIPLEVLEAYLQSKQMIVFDTATDADLGSLAITPSQPPKVGEDCGSGQVYDCALTCVDTVTAVRWIEDDYCDDGRHSHDGVPYDIACPTFFYDGGDCD